MRVNPVLSHDYNFMESPPQYPEVIRCAGYDNPRPAPDYSPRDTRQFLSACRDRNCPAERCLDMPEDEPWNSSSIAAENVSPVASDAGEDSRVLSALPGVFKSSDMA